ncbi:hypothetical protein [Spiroplasma endosymbiont of Lariophagus distinguendus]|uniref:hypothetical protein n=1 Tax=Spiroplasma endosymbiont of Lariophagus distinguendus TaxID=2935082 RepID=UPI0020795D45|nr:hypothetical protein [Spiroplasma endosymbiont of Lariophagus distinguendus]
MAPFFTSHNTFEIWFYLIFMNKHQTWNSINWCCKRIGVTLKTAWRMGHKIRTWLPNKNLLLRHMQMINVSFTYGF